jgi:hypothetical protein
MVPRLLPLPRMRFRIKNACFGLQIGEEIVATESTPATKGQLVIVRVNNKNHVARYQGRSVEMSNGTSTFLYKLVGVIDPR